MPTYAYYGMLIECAACGDHEHSDVLAGRPCLECVCPALMTWHKIPDPTDWREALPRPRPSHPERH